MEDTRRNLKTLQDNGDEVLWGLALADYATLIGELSLFVHNKERFFK